MNDIKLADKLNERLNIKTAISDRKYDVITLKHQ